MEEEIKPDFDEILEELVALMKDGAEQRAHPFHIITIASINKSGQPEVRSVVLREFDYKNRVIRFHTDYRSPKVKELENNPHITILCYSPEHKVQLRINAQAEIHHKDEIALAAWNNTRPCSRKCYCITEAPGSEIDSPTNALPELIESRDPNEEESEKAYENFSVVICKFNKIDYLKLRSSGHYRAEFKWEGNDLITKWLVP